MIIPRDEFVRRVTKMVRETYNKGAKMKSIIGWSVFGTIVLVFAIIIGSIIGLSNTEVELRTLIEAKQKDNSSEFDNMFKKISQVAQVSSKQMESLKDIFNSYADARSNDGQGKMMSWIQEAIPNVDTTTFNNLQNIITSSRDAWTMRQKELIDLSREHTVMLRRFPAGWILTTFMGRKPIEIVIVTSSRTEESFKTGKDDDISVF